MVTRVGERQVDGTWGTTWLDVCYCQGPNFILDGKFVILFKIIFKQLFK